MDPGRRNYAAEARGELFGRDGFRRDISAGSGGDILSVAKVCLAETRELPSLGPAGRS